MTVYQPTQVYAREDIAVEDQYRIIGSAVQIVRHVANSSACAERLILGDIYKFDSESGTISEILFEDLRAIRGTEDDPGDTGLPCSRNLMLSHRDSGDRQHGLGSLHGQGPQAGPLPAHEQHGFSHIATVPYASLPSALTSGVWA